MDLIMFFLAISTGSLIIIFPDWAGSIIGAMIAVSFITGQERFRPECLKG